MPKTLKSVLLVGAGIALIAFSGGIAGALAPLLGSAITAGVVTSVGISLALAGASSLLMKTPKVSTAIADRLSINYDPTAPRKIIFGRTAAGSDLRFKETHGAKSDRLSIVLALASHKISAVNSISLDGKEVWQNGSLTNATGIQKLVPVLCGTSANGLPHGTGAYWTSAATFVGCAYSFITYIADSKLWPSGLPSAVIHVVDGCPVYDPRLDSTRGGSASLRAEDQSTWLFNSPTSGVAIGRNPALALLTYLIGWRINGKLAWGMGISLDKINLDNFIQYANICEEQVQAKGGGNIQRFTCDGAFSTNDSHENVINTICAAMGSAICIDLDGVYQLVGGFDDTLTPALAFTGDDILSGGEWNKSPPIRDRHTRITGRFADPSQDYKLGDWGLIEVDPLYDGIPRTNNVDLGCVSRAETAQRIGKQMLLREKYSGLYTAVFGPRAFGVSVGSLMTLSLPAHGFNSKLFRVESQSETDDLQFTMMLREESSEIYAWDKDEAKALPSTILADVFDPIEAASVSGLAIAARSVGGANSVTSNWIDVTWSLATSARVVSIEIQAREAGVDTWTTVAERGNDTGSLTFSSGVNGAAIDVRARYRMQNGINGPWANTSLTSTPVSTVNRWQFITDNGTGKKPADGATNSADLNSPFGSGGRTVGGTITLLDGHSTKIQSIQDAIESTELGNTAAANAAKEAAEAARNAAQAAQLASENARDAGATARDDAHTYRDQADYIVNNPSGSIATVQSNVSALQAQMAGTSSSGLKTYANSAATTAAAAIVAPGSSIANSIATLQTQFSGTADSGLKTLIADNATAASTATTAVANRAARLEAASIKTSINANPDFTAWPDGQVHPTSYSAWGNAAPARITGINGAAYAAQQVVAAGVDTIGFSQTALRKTRGWYVLEADVRIKGSFLGAGMQFGGAGGGGEYLTLNFGTDADVNGVVRATSDQDFWSYKWRKLVQANYEDYGSTLYCFVSYSGLGSISIARTIIWDHAAVRSATEGEIAGKRADINANTALAKITVEETSRIRDDQALSDRSTTLEAQIAGTANSGLKSSFNEQITTLTTANSALSTRATVLEATATTSLIQNPNFTYWPGTIPTSWLDWSNGYLGTKTSGKNGKPNALTFTVGTNISGGLLQVMPTGLGAYVITVTVEAAVYQGAGFLFYFLDSANGILSSHICNFASDADTGDFVSGGGNVGTLLRTFTKFVKSQAGTVTSVQLYLMANWSYLGAQSAKMFTFHSANVRPATAAEIAAQKASDDLVPLTARVGTVETATTDGRFATAQRATNLEAQLAGSLGSGLGSRLSTVETATTDGRFSSASRSSVLEAQMAGSATSNLRGRIEGLETTTSDGRFASATSVRTLTASSSGTSLNLNPTFGDYPDPNALPGSWLLWGPGNNSRVPNGRFSPYAFRQENNDGGNGTVKNSGLYQNYANTNGLKSQGQIWVVMEATFTLVQGNLLGAGMFCQNTTGASAATINFYYDIPDGSTSALGAGTAGQTYTFSKLVKLDSGLGLNLYAMTSWAGYFDGIVYKQLDWHKCSIRLATAGEILAQKTSGDLGNYATITSLNQVTNDQNSARATQNSSIDARFAGTTGSYLSSSVYNNSQAISSLNGKTSAYWQVGAVAGNNRAQLYIHADANGGAGVDIVGDVSISGNLLVSGTINSGKFVTNATCVPARGFATDYVYGQYQSLSGVADPRMDVCYAVITTTEAGWVEIQGKFQQGFSQPAPWFAALAINGYELGESYAGGGLAQDTVSTQGAVYVGPGTFTCTLRWQAHTSVTLRERSIFVKGFQKTA